LTLLVEEISSPYASYALFEYGLIKDLVELPQRQKLLRKIESAIDQIASVG